MKTKLLLIALFVSYFTFGQLPTSNLTRSYNFTNGSLVDAANGDNLIQAGTAITNVNDRFSSANNGVSLNGDYLSTTNFSFTDFSISFWIKTDINDTNERTIIDKSERTGADYGGENNGIYIYLKEGRIGFKASRIIKNNNQINNIRVEGDRFFNEFVSNNNWHHITITIKKEATRFSAGAGGRNIFPYSYKFYVDGILEQTSGEEITTDGIRAGRDYQNGGSLTIGNIKSGTLTSDNIFTQNIDDIHIYSRVLTATEINQITTLNNYTICETPDITDVSVSNITENSIDIVIAGTDTYDVAYGLKSEPFANYTILTSIPQNSFTITNLLQSSLYNIQYRKVCSANTTFNTISSWSTPLEFLTDGPIFVNKTATGLNDGSSWANAFTDLQDALVAVKDSGEIWVTKGTYTPDASDRNATFLIDKENIKLYGGFAGTETSIAERNIKINETILSGDLQNNDSGTIDFAEASMSDNSHHIISVEKNGFIVDGVTISSGNAVDASFKSSAAINIKSNIGSSPLSILGFTVRNAIIKNNMADNGAFFYYQSTAFSSVTRNIVIENTIVENNLSRYGTIHVRKTNANLTNIKIHNSLFKDNVIKDNGGAKGQGGSVIWLLANNIPTSQIVNLDISNCTIVNNQDLGTNNALNNFTRTPIMLLNLASLETKINNTIFWNNTTIGGVNSRIVSSGDQANYGALEINNSISNLDFANQTPAEKNNTSNSDPLFTSATDFTLQTTSSAIDSGDNTKLPADLFLDLLGKNRIHNGTVDLGVYEFGAGNFTPRNLTISSVNGIVVSNPTSVNGVYADGISVVLTATPDAGFQFNGWSGDATGTTNPLTITMDADKNITANFVKTRVFVNSNATGNNDGTSWADAYTDLKDAIVNTSGSADFWVAAGTYKAGTNKSERFTLGNELSIYGGFNGTETMLSERDFNKNKTILSGDLNDNDNGILTFNTSYNDNTSQIIVATGNNIIIDGITIKGGNSLAASAIYIASNTQNLTVRNTTFSDNRATSNSIISGEARSNSATEDYDYIFENCLFEKNLGRLATIFYLSSPELNGGFKVNTKFVNSIFTSNKIMDFNSNTKGINTLFWFRTDLSETQNVQFINNTITGNIFDGTDNSNSGIISASRINGTVSVEVYNTIFWNNLLTNGTEKKSIDRIGTQAVANSVIVNNSLDPLNFSGATNVLNNIITNPNFFAASNSDFTLAANSPAINSGNNNFLPSTISKDFLGNARIFNTTVDMGAIEYDPSLIVTKTLSITATNGIVTTNPNPTNGVYAENTSVELTATPDAGYKFDGWSGDATGTTNPLNITMDADKSVTALFSRIQRTLTITATNGTVSTNPNPVNGTYDDGTVVSLTATPDAGYQFDGFREDISGANLLLNSGNPLSTTITLNTDKSVTAFFSRIQRTLTITATNGSVSTNPSPVNGTYDDGTVVTLIATPDAGYQFDGWSGDATGTTNPLNITMDADKSVTALFSRIQRTLTITATNGTVSTNPSPVNGTYDDGTVVTLTATPDAGFALINWSIVGAKLKDSSTIPTSITITMDKDQTVAAVFDATASVDDELINSFSLYPNPTNNVLHISTDLEIKNCKVYNVIGKKVLQSKSKEIKVSNLPKGMYLIQIITAKGKSVTKKFVKK